MQYGLELPNQGDYGDALCLAELADLAEQSGWDGVFIWDCLHYTGANQSAVSDPWIALTAMAMRTQRIRLGALMTPLARRRPWKVARESVTLDRLSGGRLTMGVSLGDLADDAFTRVGEVTDTHERARVLDEGLAILEGLWCGRPFQFNGRHYHLEEMTFLPTSIQTPHIPIWVGGYWPHQAPLRRAARYEGMCPGKVNPDGSPGDLEPEDVRQIGEAIAEHRPTMANFDIVVAGQSEPTDPLATIAPFAVAGATWWLESAGAWPQTLSLTQMRQRILQGPPNDAL